MAAKKKSWYKWALIALLVILLFAFFDWVMYQRYQQKIAFADNIIQKLNRNPDVQQLLGNNIMIQPGTVSGKVDPKAGHAAIEMQVSSKQHKNMDVTVTAKQVNGRWQFTELMVDIPGQAEPVDLLAKQQEVEQQERQAAEEAARKQAFNDGVTTYEAGDYVNAIVNFRAALSIRYRVKESLQYLAASYMALSQYEECTNIYNYILKVEPNNAEAYYWRAYCELQTYHFDDAHDDLSKACQMGYQDACASLKAMDAKQ